MSAFSKIFKTSTVVPPAEHAKHGDFAEAEEGKTRASADPLNNLKISQNREELLKSFTDSLREQLANFQSGGKKQS